MSLRKELVCFVETTEQGIEASIRAMKGDVNAVLIEHEGHKFAISRESLQEALKALNEFYDPHAEFRQHFSAEEKPSVFAQAEQVPVYQDVEYINEDEPLAYRT